MTVAGMITKAKHLVKGENAENTACEYLQHQGLKLLARNSRSPYGEIDIVMLDGETLVFVEVRYRKNSSFGLAQETVGTSKQQRIIRSAQWFLQQNSRYSETACRFDIIAINSINSENKVTWIKDAFC